MNIATKFNIGDTVRAGNGKVFRISDVQARACSEPRITLIFYKPDSSDKWYAEDDLEEVQPA